MKPGILAIIAVGLLAMAPSSEKAIAQNSTEVRKKIHQSFDLPANAVVEVQTIPGSVTVETGSSQTAQIDATLTSPTPADLDCNQIAIERTAQGLSINGHSTCQISRGGQQLHLRLPSKTNLTLRMIAGSIKVPALNGFLRLDSIAGHAEVACNADAEMSSLARGLTLSLSNTRDSRVKVSSVVGDIDLGIADLDADLSVNSYIGQIRDEIGEGVTETTETSFRLRLGAGRNQIRFSSIRGDIKIHRVPRT